MELHRYLKKMYHKLNAQLQNGYYFLLISKKKMIAVMENFANKGLHQRKEHLYSVGLLFTPKPERRNHILNKFLHKARISYKHLKVGSIMLDSTANSLASSTSWSHCIVFLFFEMGRIWKDGAFYPQTKLYQQHTRLDSNTMQLLLAQNQFTLYSKSHST